MIKKGGKRKSFPKLGVDEQLRQSMKKGDKKDGK
jgi:hypothetical protein